MFFVVPSIRELFQDRSLHPITKAVFGISSFLQAYGFYVLGVFLLIVVLAVFLFRDKRYRYFVQKQFLRVSFLKRIVLNSALIIFCRTVSVLVAGGVPLVDALKLTAEGIKYLPLKEAIETSQKRILEGKSFSEEMGRFSFIPSLVIRMLTIAEKTGKFSEMVMSCSLLYQEELDRDLRKLTTLLQPILLITLGIVVGIVLLSILIPITDVSSMLNM